MKSSRRVFTEGNEEAKNVCEGSSLLVMGVLNTSQNDLINPASAG